MKPAKQPSMKDHPEGTASFMLRVAFNDATECEVFSPKPKPIVQIIEELEKQIFWLREVLARGVAK